MTRKWTIRLLLPVLVGSLVTITTNCSEPDWPSEPDLTGPPPPTPLYSPPPSSASPSPSSNEVYQIKVVYDTPPSPYPTAKAWDRWIEAVEDRSNGRIEVTLYPNGSLYKENEIFTSVQDGSVELGQINTITASSHVPGVRRSAILLFPYLLSWEQLPDFFASPIWSALTKPTERPGTFQWLGTIEVSQWYATRELAIITKNREVKSLDNLSGLLIRPLDPSISSQTLDVLGAFPSVYITSAEAETKVAEGVLDGVVGSYTWWYLDFGNTLKYGLDAGNLSGNVVCHIIANKKWWDNLPTDIRSILEDAFTEGAAYSYQYTSQYEEELKEKLTELGCSIRQPVPDDLSHRQDIIRRLWDDLKGWYGGSQGRAQGHRDVEAVIGWSEEWKRTH